MRIAVHLLTRGRPAGLVGAIHAFHATASGDLPVHYVICADDDDPTLEQARDLLGHLPVAWSINPRPDALGLAWTQGAVSTAWDLALFTGDDTVPATWHWDRRMVENAAAAPAFAWTELNDPTNCTYWATTRRWHDAVGRACPDLFPFWFNDTWAAEQHLFAFGRPIPIDRHLQMAGRRGTTREMREVSFWFRVFAATRPQRIAEAHRIARAYGRQPPDPAPMLEWCRGWDAAQQASVERYNRIFAADTVAPTARYNRLRAKAAALLAPSTIRIAPADVPAAKAEIEKLGVAGQ